MSESKIQQWERKTRNAQRRGIPKAERKARHRTWLKLKEVKKPKGFKLVSPGVSVVQTDYSYIVPTPQGIDDGIYWKYKNA